MIRKLLLIALSLLVTLSSTQYLGKNEQGLDVFKIDLNLAPKDRFKEVANMYGPRVKDIISKYEAYLPTFVLNIFKYLDVTIWWFHPEKYEEITGMSEVVGIDPHLGILMNYMYEFTSFCTSFIAKMDNGTIIHMRNMDFGFKEEMQNITYVASFYRGDMYMYDAVIFAGMVGTFTGFKSGAFSITLNQRTPSDNWSLYDLLTNVAMIFMSYQQSSWSIRDTLAQCHNYKCAYDQLTSESIIAPSYIILAGTQADEGVIITRDRTAVANVTQISDDQWYIVQTNQDIYTGDCRIRCQTARNNFEKIGRQNLTVENAYEDVLQQWPNLNFLSIHSSVMVPSLGIFQSQIVNAYNNTDPGDL